MPKLLKTPFAAEAEAGFRTDIQESTGVAPNSATYQVGFPPNTMQSIAAGGMPPKGSDLNGVLYDITDNLVFLTQGGGYGFDAAYATSIGGYPLNARLRLTNGDIVKSTIDGNVNNPNTDMTGWDFDDDSVSNINKLRLKPAKKGKCIYLISINEGQGEGGGEFIATQESGLVDDGGLVVSSPDPLLFWVRINYDYVTPEMFGATSGDSYESLQKAFNHALPVVLAAKTYNTSRPILITNGKKVVGSGYQKTVINKTTNSTNSGIGSDYDKDAILIARHFTSTDYTHYMDISGLLLTCPVDINCAYGFYAPRLAESNFSNFRVSNAKIGIYSDDAWMIKWDRVVSSNDQPFVILGGTSNVFNACWATNAKGATNYAYRFENLYYSTLISCGADYCGTDGSPIKALFRILNSNLSLIECASENTHAYKFAHMQGADVKFDKYQAMYFNNKYVNSSPTWGDANALFDGRSETRLIITGCRFDWVNKSLSNTPRYIDISDTSTLYYSDNNTSVKCTGVSFSNESVFGISYSSATSVYVDLGNYEFDNSSERDYYSGTNTVLGLDTKHSYKFNFFNSNIGFNATVPNTLAINTPQMRSIGTTAFYQAWGNPASTTVNGYPRDGAGWVIAQFGEGNINGTTNTAVARIAFRNDSYGAYIQTGTSGNNFLEWYELKTSKNTTVDGNGFIKAASPIVQLYADKIELNDEATQQEITFEKLGVGDYLIKGSTGFSQEGWYIETPKDANGNVLFSVIYETLENGDISVKTYKKKFDLETVSIVADLTQPVDITVGRWIDLRLQELTQITNETQ